jgi:hypothetical protein
MAKPVLDDALWAIIEPVLPKPKWRRFRFSRPQTDWQPRSADGDFVCAHHRYSLGIPASRVGVRQRHELLATLTEASA